MNYTPRLLGISGALRKASSNTMLVHEAARAFGHCQLTVADIRFPLYDRDLEDAEGIPPAVRTLVEQARAADAIVISTPEYNKNLPGVLKNALDWFSRDDITAMRDVPLAIVSSAAGRAGGERSQFSLRHCLVPFRPRVLQGPEVMIAGAAKAFDENGRLTDPRSFELLQQLMGQLRQEMALAA
ncbi:NADPH-dependent FMN reductase [Rhodobacteraceae bacterium 2CG4]|uniref:NADPH-dependent FMN reductase n=1 Tax=Halovulum marinum TaxID=2662447 RepID=A0A6L5YY43_9RHOB|nr:NAD(P)H-dependent oxidoreductase [Halovulum marinum]MSU88604.1 NADPH-dependent FMN reductase [Halovulum marinum]